MSTPRAAALPTAPDTFGALRAMQAIILAECLVHGASPFAALSATDAARFGVANAVLVGRPKDFKDAYNPQCLLWVAPGSESATLAPGMTRAFATFEAHVQVFVDLRQDWYAAEQLTLSIRDALWPALLRHAWLGGTVPSVIESEARPGRGLFFEQVAGVEYRCFEAAWNIRQQWVATGGQGV